MKIKGMTNKPNFFRLIHFIQLATCFIHLKHILLTSFIKIWLEKYLKSLSSQYDNIQYLSFTGLRTYAIAVMQKC